MGEAMVDPVERKVTPEEQQIRENPPAHVAIIMDGNGRWAKSRGFSRIRGHRAGAESIREIVRSAGELGVGFLTLYAFSVDNWKRPRREVAALMNLLKRFLAGEERELQRNNVRLWTIGRISEFPPDVQHAIDAVVKSTAGNTGLTLVLALNYGGRAEITDAVRALCEKSARGEVRAGEIDEALISRSLYTADIPDPDLLIRTSGEMRVSNFLLWQISYAELYVTPVYWPDFRRQHFVRALLDFQKRERRFGGVEPPPNY
ncbi:MAG: isoprenyl transferase [Candidatus Aureabacteria bacterium]|nr:isoprenyl transferase [Candidatus Auribacterota bacterium]